MISGARSAAGALLRFLSCVEDLEASSMITFPRSDSPAEDSAKLPGRSRIRFNDLDITRVVGGELLGLSERL